MMTRSVTHSSKGTTFNGLALKRLLQSTQPLFLHTSNIFCLSFSLWCFSELFLPRRLVSPSAKRRHIMESEDLDSFFDSLNDASAENLLLLCDQEAPTLGRIEDANDPLHDPVFQNIYQENNNYYQSSGSGETSGVGGSDQVPNNQGGSYWGFGEPRGVPVWPIPPVPFSCTCCQVLREITHTNGVQVTKLGIHGALGIISHVVLETRYANPLNGPPQYQMFDFCKKSIEDVKGLLEQYCEDRKQSGYSMLQDPLSTFYEALCVGIINVNNGIFLGNVEEFLGLTPLASPIHDDSSLPIQPQPLDIDEGPRHKSALSAQRERTKNLTIKDFAPYSGLPINVAAKEIEVCPTVVKKICRKSGLDRWPYRKIRSLEKKIAEKREILNISHGAQRRSIEREIEPLERKLAEILDKFYQS